MSELRYNLISRDWVIISSERAKRPSDFVKQKTPTPPLPERKDNCPFCPGNEATCGEETFRLGSGKAWKTRSIYNKFPALFHSVEEERKTSGSYKWISGFGVHEVIVENPLHNTAIALMPDEEVCNVVRTYLSRYKSIQEDKRIKAITIFKNHGPAAGCSQEHPHSQLIATPIVPPNIRSRVENAVEYFDVTGICILCQMLNEELAEKKRLVLETDKFVSFIPYASFSPFVMWIVPRRHMGSFDHISEDEVCDLARSLKLTLGKLYYGLDNPDFNFTIRSIPVREKGNESFHWHINVMPRLSQPAGFELGSGIFINASSPEDSAEFLRKITCK